MDNKAFNHCQPNTLVAQVDYLDKHYRFTVDSNLILSLSRQEDLQHAIGSYMMRALAEFHDRQHQIAEREISIRAKLFALIGEHPELSPEIRRILENK